MPTLNPRVHRRAWLQASAAVAASAAIQPLALAAPRQDVFDAIQQEPWPWWPNAMHGPPP